MKLPETSAECRSALADVEEQVRLIAKRDKHANLVEVHEDLVALAMQVYWLGRVNRALLHRVERVERL